MIRWLFILVAVSSWCFGPIANAADLPLGKVKQTTHRLKASVKPKPLAAERKKLATKLPPSAIAPDGDQVASSPAVETAPNTNEIKMSWILDPLTANADGSKKEGSASVEGNLIVVEPGYVSLPYMVIELSGHIVKTTQTTVRLDVRIGDVQRTVTWKPDDVQAGRFKVELNAPLQEGKLPTTFPVSALAIVTKDGREGVAMVSLEKITVRLGKVRTAEAQ
jgi:hypothetical protein